MNTSRYTCKYQSDACSTIWWHLLAKHAAFKRKWKWSIETKGWWEGLVNNVM